MVIGGARWRSRTRLSSKRTGLCLATSKIPDIEKSPSQTDPRNRPKSPQRPVSQSPGVKEMCAKAP